MASKTLTKNQLIDKLASDAKTEKKVAAALLDALTAHIHATLTKGGEVRLQDLGKFKVAKRKARIGRNPATGQPIKIAAKTVARFLVAKALKDLAKKAK